MNATFTSQFATFAALKEAVTCARDTAAVEARRCAPFVWSRGTWFITAGTGNQGRVRPCDESGGHYWRGTKQEITKLISEVLLSYPEVQEIVLQGGYDGGQQMSDRDDGNYEPWVSEWEVTLWKRTPGEAKPVTCTCCEEAGHSALATTTLIKGLPACQPCADYEKEELALWSRARETAGI